VFRVKYDDEQDAGWEVAPDGFGASLELICDTADPNLGYSWRASTFISKFDFLIPLLKVQFPLELTLWKNLAELQVRT
jgi:hypothetical protein